MVSLSYLSISYSSVVQFEHIHYNFQQLSRICQKGFLSKLCSHRCNIKQAKQWPNKTHQKKQMPYHENPETNQPTQPKKPNHICFLLILNKFFTNSLLFWGLEWSRTQSLIPLRWIERGFVVLFFFFLSVFQSVFSEPLIVLKEREKTKTDEKLVKISTVSWQRFWI